MGTTPQFSLPPLRALSFVPFLYLQAVLLHPAIPSRWSRPLRLLLMIPALFLSAVAPFWWRIEPLEWSVGANFRWGIFGPNFIMKALEWGLVEDRSPYTWLGFDEVKVVPRPLAEDSASPSSSTPSTPTLNGYSTSTLRSRHPTSTLPTPPDSPRTPILGGDDIGSSGKPLAVKRQHRRFAAEHATPLTIALDALHLLTAMRGIGYAFGPPVKALAPGSPRGKWEFAKKALGKFVRSHIISTMCLLIIIERERHVPQLLHTFLLPFFTPNQLQPLANILSYLAVGVSLHAQMLVGFEGASLVFLAADFLPLPESVRPRFDAREWPELFWRPFEPETVTIFWSQHWHALFRKPFTTVGYEPVSRLVTNVAGKKAGRAAGAVMVFALSGWMHDQALFSARYSLPLSHVPLSITQRYGGWIFFLSQSLACILESLAPLLTGRPFPRRGWFARIWGYAWVIGLGCLAGRCWIALGLAEGLPEVERWSWQRFWLPTTALAPPPLFTR